MDGAMYLAPTCTVCLALLSAALIVIDCMVIMLIKRVIQFSTRNSIRRIYGWI